VKGTRQRHFSCIPGYYFLNFEQFFITLNLTECVLTFTNPIKLGRKSHLQVCHQTRQLLQLVSWRSTVRAVEAVNSKQTNNYVSFLINKDDELHLLKFKLDPFAKCSSGTVQRKAFARITLASHLSSFTVE